MVMGDIAAASYQNLKMPLHLAAEFPDGIQEAASADAQDQWLLARRVHVLDSLSQSRNVSQKFPRLPAFLRGVGRVRRSLKPLDASEAQGLRILPDLRA